MLQLDTPKNYIYVKFFICKVSFHIKDLRDLKSSQNQIVNKKCLIEH